MKVAIDFTLMVHVCGYTAVGKPQDNQCITGVWNQFKSVDSVCHDKYMLITNVSLCTYCQEGVHE